MTKITNFAWNSVDDCIISELDGAGSVQATYTNEPQQYGGVVSQRRGTTTSTYHADALGSTRFLTDSSGNVTDTYVLDAWGILVASTGTTVNPFKWVGKYGYYTDNSTGLVYVRARMYQPTVARWCSVDPLLFVDGANLYLAYSVLLLADPSGQTCQLLKEKTQGPAKVVDIIDGKKAPTELCWRFDFSTELNFKPPDCDCCRFRQYVDAFSILIWLESGTQKLVQLDRKDEDPGHEDCLDGACYGDMDHQDKFNVFTNNGCTFSMYDRPGQCKALIDFPKIPKVGSNIRIKARIWGKFTQVLFDRCCHPRDFWYRHIPFDFDWDDNLGDVLREAKRRQ